MPVQNPGLQKEVQAPNVAQGRALNLSQEAKASADMAADFGKSIARGIGNVASGVVQYKADKQNADDLLASNNAFNEYSKQLSDLNAMRNTQHGADAVNFKPKYNKMADALHANIVHIMDGGVIKSEKVREDLRAKINAINTRNREESFLYFDREERALKKQANDEMLDNLANQAVDKFVNGGGATNNENLDNLFSQIESGIQSQMESDGFHTLDDDSDYARQVNEGINVMFSNQVMEKRKKVLDSITEYLNETNRDLNPWQETASAIKLMEYARDKGYVDNEYAQKKLNEFEKKALGVELMRTPEKYWDPKTGQYNRKLVMSKVKYLSQDDIERAAKVVHDASASNPGASAELGGMAPAIAEEAYQQDKLFRWQRGFFTKEEENDYIYSQGWAAEDGEAKEWKQRMAQLRRDTPIEEIVQHNADLYAMQFKPVYFDPTINKAINVDADGNFKALTPEQEQRYKEAVKNKTLVEYYPLANSELYQKEVIKQFETMSDMAMVGHAVNKDTRTTRKAPGFISGGYKYKVAGVAAQNLWNFFYKEAYNQKDQFDRLPVVDTDSYNKAFALAVDLARNGGWVRADESYANSYLTNKDGKYELDENGLKIPIRTFAPIDINRMHDTDLNDEQKASLAAIQIAALSMTISPGRLSNLKNDAWVKQAKMAAQRDKAGYRASSGNLFYDDTTGYGEPSPSEYGFVGRFGYREAQKAVSRDIRGPKI